MSKYPILEMLGMAFGVSACTAAVTAPCTAPVWLIVGVLALTRPAQRTLWKWLTAISLLQLASITGAAFFVWLDNLQHWLGKVHPAVIRDTQNSLVLGVLLTVATTISWILPNRNKDSLASLQVSVAIQFIVVLVVVGFVVGLIYFYNFVLVG